MISSLFRLSGRSAIDLPVAALAALSVAFVGFAAPAELLGELVALTGLPAILPAAAPPLGATARIAIALGGSAIVFALVLALLGWLDRFAAPPRPRLSPEPEAVPERPRLRKRDAHPDASAVKPVSAARDFASFEAAPEPPAAPVPAPEPAAAIAAAPPPPAFVLPEATDSLPNLMARLEAGLARRETAPARRAAPDPRPAGPANDRLQSAIESLQRLAARQT